METDRYIAKIGDLRVSGEKLDFLRRRTTPFLDNIGLNRPISTVVQEAYLQGIRDAIDIMEERRGI